MNEAKDMYTDFLSKIPCSAVYEKVPAEKISKTAKEFYSLFEAELTEDYINLLHQTNGLSCDGHSICGVYDEDFLADHPRKGSMDILRFNSSFRDMTDITDYILLGKSSLDYVVYDIAEKKYQILSNGTMECFGSFDSFPDLLYAFFEIEK